MNRVKTWVLIAALMGLFVWIGSLVGGAQGATIALVLAFVFNAFMYWKSDAIAIRATRSRPATEAELPHVFRIVRELTQAWSIPMPRIYVSEMDQPNAFATGRDPEHAAVSVTRGILQVLDEKELRGVLAHELSHVTNRDILISSIAAAIGTAITYLAYMVMFFGGSRDDDEGGIGGLGFLVAWLLAPLAAGIIQMAVSRSREFQADDSGAHLSRDPMALASALQKLEAYANRVPAPVQPSQAHLFIVNPLRANARGAGGGIASLFRTHPSTPERVQRLREIAHELGQPA